MLTLEMKQADLAEGLEVAEGSWEGKRILTEWMGHRLLS